MDIMFQPMEFVNNLAYMGLGMLGIMIVMGVIIIATVALNKFIRPKDDNKDDN